MCGTSLPRFKQSPVCRSRPQRPPHNEIRDLLIGWTLTMQIGSAQRGDIRANRATLLSTGLWEERNSDLRHKSFEIQTVAISSHGGRSRLQRPPHAAHNKIKDLLSGWKLTMQIGSAQRGDIRANRATLLSTGLSEERSSDCPTDFR
ncbi:hypothetical protein CDAR_177961 [Caerostris darwini]|uniref:Uncharacterized protein n=1 Tax=Caerostris darwini TaxID=1538125 RepID=A0AAV4WFC8_9ARAC|nr:hypothetical protein CDAR_177961 [Caerostris darwini]